MMTKSTQLIGMNSFTN